jgi:hypothetical protein
MFIHILEKATSLFGFFPPAVVKTREVYLGSKTTIKFKNPIIIIEKISQDDPFECDFHYCMIDLIYIYNFTLTDRPIDL